MKLTKSLGTKKMQLKTTVKGYKLIRQHPKLGELESWHVLRYSKNNNNNNNCFIGYLKKVKYVNIADSIPITIFWIWYFGFKIGWKYIQKRGVANTRTQAVLDLSEAFKKHYKIWTSANEE